MRIRRCSAILIDPREVVRFDLESLSHGGSGLTRTVEWVVLAPHLGVEIVVSEAELVVLGAMSPSQWVDLGAMPHDQRPIAERLLEMGLLVIDKAAEGGDACRDARYRQVHWHALAGVLHAFTRWDGVDAERSMRELGMLTAKGLEERLGKPPAAVEGAAEKRVPLPAVEATDFDALLLRRATCRNFDPGRPLTVELLSQLLHRVFGAQGQVAATPDTVFLKKNSPSGGGLHPVEAYIIVQHVRDMEPGLYHYRPVDHALTPLAWTGSDLRGLALSCVAQQHWFADAHVLVVLAPRFDRTFWKYRHHAKGYRVVALEAGHLSQTLYLSATEAGLGAFITGAINEVQIEEAFGLDPIHQGALAICGFGWRSQTMETAELDPAGHVWEAAQREL